MRERGARAAPPALSPSRWWHVPSMATLAETWGFSPRAAPTFVRVRRYRVDVPSIHHRTDRPRDPRAGGAVVVRIEPFLQGRGDENSRVGSDRRSLWRLPPV
jgi:hypothetical protein